MRKTSCAWRGTSIPSASISLRAAGPGSNPKDMAFFGRAEGRVVTDPGASGCLRLNASQEHGPPDEDPQVRMLVDAHTPIVTLFGKSSAFQVHEVLRYGHGGKPPHDRGDGRLAEWRAAGK